MRSLLAAAAAALLAAAIGKSRWFTLRLPESLFLFLARERRNSGRSLFAVLACHGRFMTNLQPCLIVKQIDFGDARKSLYRVFPRFGCSPIHFIDVSAEVARWRVFSVCCVLFGTRNCKLLRLHFLVVGCFRVYLVRAPETGCRHSCHTALCTVLEM